MAVLDCRASAVKAAIGMWHRPHVSSITWRCSGWAPISALSVASQYGSRAALAISVPRHSAPMETSAPASSVRFSWQTAHAPEAAKYRPRSVGSGAPLSTPADGADVGVKDAVAVGGGGRVGRSATERRYRRPAAERRGSVQVEALVSRRGQMRNAPFW